MDISRFLSSRTRTTLGIGMLAGVAIVAAIAPTFPTPTPEVPANKLYRPNISTLELPRKLDFCGEALPMEDPEVRKRMDREFLLNLQWDGQVMLYLKRSGEFFPMFERVLKEEGAPDDLKYLATAESALFQAQSGKGAVGLWQFIAETGRRYGLRIDDFVDERKDPEKSTRAAIKLLKANKERFGSWALSAAAYNMGEGATQDDLSFQRRYSIPEGTRDSIRRYRTYFDLYLNEETSRYLFRIVALKEIMSNPEKYGYFLERDDYYRPVESTKVSVSEEIPNLAVWAESQGTTYKHVKLLNPWILKRSLPKPPSGQPYQITVPVRQG